MRSEFGHWLQSLGVQGERLDDLLVVVSELGANAVRESASDAELPTITATCGDGTIELEVTNEVDERSHEPADSWDLDDPLRAGGRGLLLVSALVDDVDVAVEGRRLSVRCTVDLDDGQRGSTVT